ncbi:MAG: hypothetical protein LBH32_00550 [Dysgonamonadaceae bacterium]|jgi:hypothetical protein|nr:hypothetical protein [Dysgonamonadaceae bacterium]
MESVINPFIVKELLQEYDIKLKDVSIITSIISSYDLGGLTVPQSVSNIIKTIDCDFNLSFISEW